MSARPPHRDDARPRLARWARLQRDHARGRWVLQAPERILVLSPTAHAIVRQLDGARSVGAVAEALAREYDAPPGQIRQDLEALLDALAARGLLREEEA